MTTDAVDGRLLMQAVEEVARLAGDVAHRHYRARLAGGIAVETKADGSPVTAADREAEGTARDWIERRFPGDGILGEEFGLTRGDSRRRWVLDPIDGTKTFVAGVPLWGTLVGVVEGDEVLAGGAYFPPVGEMLVAAPGEGCWWNGARCSVSSVSDLAEATVVTTSEQFTRTPQCRDGWRELAGQSKIARTWGDCFGYLMVATGRAELMTDGSLSEWDAACFLPIIEEAGGVFTDWSGRRTYRGKNAIATNAALARVTREILRMG